MAIRSYSLGNSLKPAALSFGSLAAEAVGAKGFAVSRAEVADAILDQAFACEGVVVVEATVDSYEPMMPPRMPPDYRKNFLKSLADTPGREEIEANIAREPAATMFEGAK